jgi:RNA polymerase sigma-70 factor (ECF subfamily)
MAIAKPDFETLAETHSREIYYYLWRMLGDEQDAEDCLQDAFLRAYRAYARLNGDANTRAWLYKIATNTALTQIRKRSQRENRTSATTLEQVSSGMNVGTQVEEKLSLKAVHSAVQALPHKQRAALMMRKYQELSYAEIGRALDSSEESARANVYQALKKLREQLAGELEEV